MVRFRKRQGASSKKIFFGGDNSSIQRSLVGWSRSQDPAKEFRELDRNLDLETVGCEFFEQSG
jgi:hypothetical protein